MGYAISSHPLGLSPFKSWTLGETLSLGICKMGTMHSITWSLRARSLETAAWIQIQPPQFRTVGLFAW